MKTIDVGSMESFGSGNDSIVIRNYVAGIAGGKLLDTSDFGDSYIRAGHVIIRGTTNDDYKPMPVSDGAYSSLPSGYEYVGVTTATIPAEEPFAAIMYSGEVNENAVPYSVANIKAAIVASVPTLVFKHD